MGTKLTYYAIFGKDLGWTFYNNLQDKVVDSLYDNPYTENVTPKDSIILLVDGMCGKYCVFGKVLRKWNELGTEDMFELDTNELEKEIGNEIRDKAKEILGIEIDPTIIVVPHFH
jgi:hypothetical protein